jgi:hypothetical protein
MAFVIKDRVKETSVTTGTGTLSLDGAVAKFQSFVAAVGTTNTCPYAIVHQTLNEWEVGIGTVTDATPDTLARTTVLASSNADAAVNFSAGTKDVFLTAAASRSTDLQPATPGTAQTGHINISGTVVVGAGLSVNDGSLAVPFLRRGLGATHGLRWNSNSLMILNASTDAFGFRNPWLVGQSGAIFGWTNAVNDASGTIDTGLSRLAAGQVAIGNGAANDFSGSTKQTGVLNAGLYATVGAAPTIASATTIAPTKPITFISGTTTIETITPPSPISLGGGQIALIPTGVFLTGVTGNIALASTAVVSKALIMTYDVTTAKWYPSY